MNFSKFSVFRLPNTYKRFDYTPRYYDPEKEARDKKLNKLRADREILQEEEPEKRISFRQNNRTGSMRKTQTLKSNLRLVMILAALVILLYYLYTQTASAEAAQQIINK
ncbi:MAG: hypothetical protein JNJ99_03185 [Crocinitomicaceae bacterium]|nr:hypothetical protein [Crocinitomicaceae bacterium]